MTYRNLFSFLVKIIVSLGEISPRGCNWKDHKTVTEIAVWTPQMRDTKSQALNFEVGIHYGLEFCLVLSFVSKGSGYRLGSVRVLQNSKKEFGDSFCKDEIAYHKRMLARLNWIEANIESYYQDWIESAERTSRYNIQFANSIHANLVAVGLAKPLE